MTFKQIPKRIGITATIILTLLGASFPYSFQPAHAATGDLVTTTSFNVNCSSGIGVGIAFDGSHLWYSCYNSPTDLYRADPMTGVVDQSYNINGGLGALAYDSVNNVIYAGPGGPNNDCSILVIHLDATKSVTGSTTTQFTNSSVCTGLDDGLAYDGTNNTFYYSPDGSTIITQFDNVGNVLRTFSWTGSGCYNSGLAIGGNLLFQGSDGCNHVWVVDKNTLGAAYDFPTGANGVRDEDLECDTATFSGIGKQVMWSMEAYDTNFLGDGSSRRANAFEIAPGTCGVGGQPATASLTLTPSTATNPVGTSHTVVANLTVTGGSNVGVPVNFTVTGANTAGPTIVSTNASGIALFTYIGTNPGTDTITAKANVTTSSGGTITVSASATKIWEVVSRPTTTQTTSNQTGSLIPGTPVSDSAVVTGSGPSPLPDLTGTVDFQLCGPNPSPSTSLGCVPAGSVVITTPNGGTFTAISPTQSPTAAGSYCWTAAFTPAKGSQYTTSNSTTTTNECFNVFPTVTQGFMTGGGTIANISGSPSTAKHGFELNCDVTKKPNNLEINWGTGNKFHLDSLTSAICVNEPSITAAPPPANFNTYVGTGTGTYNGKSGATAMWTFTDAGEPGTNDFAKIVIKDSGGNTVLSVSGNIIHGNQQAHNK